MNDAEQNQARGVALWSIKLPDREVEIKSAMLVGRSEECDITIVASGISRKHLSLDPTHDGLLFADLGSKNGTFLNGKNIERGMAQDGDRITIGEVELKVAAIRQNAVATQLFVSPIPENRLPTPESSKLEAVPRDVSKKESLSPEPKKQKPEVVAPGQNPAPKQNAPIENSAKTPWWAQQESGTEGTVIRSRMEENADADPQMIGGGDITGPTLFGIAGAVKGMRIELEKAVYTLGRAPENDIMINDQFSSSQHARLTLKGGVWFITNMLASNGTFVNGRKCIESILATGDHIRIGDAEFLFQTVQPSVKQKKNQMLDIRSSLYFVGGIVLTVLIYILIQYLLKK